MPLTSACFSRSSTGSVRQASSLTLALPFAFIFSAKSTKRSVASPRRLSSTSSTRSRNSVSISLQTGGDRENVWIEDDVVRCEVGLLGEQFVSAGADVDLALEIVGLALFVKCHHDHSSAVSSNESRLAQEFFFAVFQADRIHYRFALYAFQAGLDHVPL